MTQPQTARSTDSEEQSARNVAANWPWVAAALTAHTSWGLYPVLARYLQTVSDLPSMTLLAFGNLIPWLVLLMLFRHKLTRQLFQTRLLWILALVIVVRAITNMLAARFTLSIYVQLITQGTPFLVILLGAGLFRERIPRFTSTAVFLCLVGAMLMMSGDMGTAVLNLDFGSENWLGIGLAFVSSLSLALYMLFVRRTASAANFSGEAVLLVQMTTIIVVTTLVSLLIGEDWGRWREIGPTDWLVFFGLSLGVFLLANSLQIGALRHIGAPLVSSLMAWRLVSALIFGALILGEWLTSWYQVLGAVIVLVTIAWYLSRQRRAQAPAPS